jgi:hypothetical protein
MQLTSKLVLTSLIINGILSGIIFLVPNLVTVGLFLLILPRLIMGLMPTVFLYHFCAAAPWLYLRNRNTLLSILLPVALVLTLALGIPSLFNERLQAEVRAEQARNAPPPLKLPKLDSIALQSNSKSEYLHCGYLCQTLLFNNVTKEVIVNPIPLGGKPVAFRLAPNAECT